MKFWDISLNLDHATFPWPGDVRFSRVENRGSGITSKIIMSTHTGTHIDAPKHFLFDKPGVDEIDLSKFVGPARVLEISSKSLIMIRDLEKHHIIKGERILFKTRNSKLYKKGKFTGDYVSLSHEAAKYLVRKKISLVGIDYLGIEAKSAPAAPRTRGEPRHGRGHPVHKTLLGAGIVNLEGLDLSKIKPGKYNLAALPLKIKGGDGSPCRAVLWKK